LTLDSYYTDEICSKERADESGAIRRKQRPFPGLDQAKSIVSSPRPGAKSLSNMYGCVHESWVDQGKKSGFSKTER
jgi:hypothetical protein